MLMHKLWLKIVVDHQHRHRNQREIVANSYRPKNYVRNNILPYFRQRRRKLMQTKWPTSAGGFIKLIHTFNRRHNFTQKKNHFFDKSICCKKRIPHVHYSDYSTIVEYINRRKNKRKIQPIFSKPTNLFVVNFNRYKFIPTKWTHPNRTQKQIYQSFQITCSYKLSENSKMEKRKAVEIKQNTYLYSYLGIFMF